MKNYIKYITIVLAAAFASVGCAHFDDMNKNPYVVYETNSESFVQPMIYGAQKQLASCEYYVMGELMQWTVNTNYESSAQLTYNYVLSENNCRMVWSLYNQFGNAQYMLDLARKECENGGGNPAMIGVALTLRSWIGHILTDTYGNVPYSKAGQIALQGDTFEYTTPYDEQKDIYVDLLRSMEEANQCFAKAKEMKDSGALSSLDFNPICDFMYDGNIEKWHRFANSLYLRILMRVANKAQESEGIISLGEEYGDLNVISKINEIYDSYLSGGGDYPVMRNLDDSARLQFSSKDSALYTSFYSTTSGNWNGQAACETLTKLMLIKYSSADEQNPDKPWDPRYFRYFTKALGAPTQVTREEMREYFDSHVSSAGNSLIGRYPKGGYTGTHIGDLKMDPKYSLLNYDEILFIFAEAGARNWIPMGQKGYKDIYLEANRQSIMQWQEGWEKAGDYEICLIAMENFVSYLDNEFDYSRAVEMIMRQKYVATVWVGVECWADYRRTGYPLLKTNGETAQNKQILPTRMRYPSTEAFQNAKWYDEAVNGWLGGENNMTTDVWWASTAESQSIRLLGRK
mgnify:CR=1 FL=1